jgi:CO/xanthine dehydrogenase Mo-binding subunit
VTGSFMDYCLPRASDAPFMGFERASTRAFITEGSEPAQPASPQPFTPSGLVVAGTADEQGQLVTGSFMDYCLPRASDAPFMGFESHAVPATC